MKMSFGSRAPRFAVVTSLMVALGIIALGLKIGSRFLPEKQPNRLSVEYSPYVRDAQRERIDWYPFSQEAFAIAKSENKPIFLEIGTATSQFSQTLTRQHFEDEEFARFLNDHFISIRCDKDEMPWVAEALDPNSSVWGELDDSLLIVLDPNGKVFDASPFRPLRMERDPGGIYEWLAAIISKWIDNPSQITDKANQNYLKNQARSKQFFLPGPDNQTVVSEYINLLSNSLSTTTGALTTGVTSVSTPIPTLLMSAGTQVPVSKAALFLLRLRESECYDHLDGGFFIGAKQAGWIATRYGKSSFQNARLAEIYARAGVYLNSPLFNSTALEIISYLNKHQFDNNQSLYFSGSYADDEPLGINPFYDLITNLGDGVSHFRVREKQNNRGALSISPSPISDLLTDTKWNLIRTEKSLLFKLRDDSKRPRIIDACYADVNGAVISSLFRIGVLLNNRELISKAEATYSAASNQFHSTLGDVNHAVEGRARVNGFLRDFVWMARASLDNYLATGDTVALNNAKRIATRIQELFDSESGAYFYVLDSFLSFSNFFANTIIVTDGESESLSATALQTLTDIAQITLDSKLIKQITRKMSQITGNVPMLGVKASGLVRTMQRLYMPTIIVNDSNPKLALEIVRQFPNETVLRADQDAFAEKKGIYLMIGESLTGPFERKEITQKLLDFRTKIAP